MSLRLIVIAVFAGGILLGIALAFARNQAGWLFLAAYYACGLMLFLIERGRYKPGRSGANYLPTAERYADPVSGRTMHVFVDPTTGKRDDRPE